ncbi:tripartite tricarboxylate transporter TctB family protein [Pseudoglutamicibacter albus]|uniref:tripartite tricarboxylate transporter TctB family protein n=1 Tax=Pseudoglutamicibacter albus TaxID=98671 RepID=UPI000C76B752|nr:tripartite tricarboxylate transporter TctB family protein [Pseudoglutamicibacter albus]PKY80798.1 hypothetical protein CYJ35_03415 [Pseudoglutamicibacter albus]WIK84950.1 tripartite tricarboxylate transporter TctB family protein [Pseudoglutamicibacter albus]
MQLPSRWSNPEKNNDRSGEQVDGARDSSDAQSADDAHGQRASKAVEGYGETLYFPARIRPETLRFPEREAPFDVDDPNAEAARRVAAAEASRKRVAKAGKGPDATQREVSERTAPFDGSLEDAVAAAQEAIAERTARDEQARELTLEESVWEAREALREQSERHSDPDYKPTEYVPIAVSRRPSSAATQDHAPQTVVLPYNLPEFSAPPEPRAGDVFRRIAATVVSTVAVVASFVLFSGGIPAGLMGQSGARVELAPLVPGLALIPAAALGLLVASGFSWKRNQHSARRQRSTGWVTAATAAAIGGWVASAMTGSWWLAVACAVLWTALAAESVRRLNLLTARTHREYFETDLPAELSLGAGAFIAAWTAGVAATASGWAVPPQGLWAPLALVAASIPVLLAAVSERGRIWAPIAFAWGATWLIIAHIVTLGFNAALIFAAGLTMVGTLIAAITRRNDIRVKEAFIDANLRRSN